MPTPEQLRQTRKRFLTDFEFWAKHCCKIRTKEGTIIPLILNAVQRRFLAAVLQQWKEKGRVRFVVLKARQQGLSTVISAFQYWWASQHSAQKGLVMAHEADSTTALFDMYTRVHENTPEMLQPKTKYHSRNELRFSELDTAIRVATAGGRGVARGETLQFTHLSEVAFWPVAFAATNFNGLIQAVPEVNDTFVFIESTANGLTGKFHDMWSGAVDGSNGYYPFFSAWFETSEYREQAPADFERSPDEDDLVAKFADHQIDNDQLWWRRRKIATNGLDMFRQEYPSTADEAFISTGRPVFNPELVQKMLERAKAPLYRMAVDGGVLNENSRGELKVYRDHPVRDSYGNPVLDEQTGKPKRHMVDPKESYYIGADIGLGLRPPVGQEGKKGTDPSVAQVLDGQLRQVAVWRGWVHPDQFAYILRTLGLTFNNALIAPERNNQGLLTCERLANDLMYPNVYLEETEGTVDGRETTQIGIFTSERTKPLVINKLRSEMQHGEIEINDETTLREMLSFVVTETGKMQAEAGCYDDCVMAIAIANHVHDGKFMPIDVTDEFYVNAI